MGMIMYLPICTLPSNRRYLHHKNFHFHVGSRPGSRIKTDRRFDLQLHFNVNIVSYRLSSRRALSSWNWIGSGKDTIQGIEFHFFLIHLRGSQLHLGYRLHLEVAFSTISLIYFTPDYLQTYICISNTETSWNYFFKVGCTGLYELQPPAGAYRDGGGCVTARLRAATERRTFSLSLVIIFIFIYLPCFTPYTTIPPFL